MVNIIQGDALKVLKTVPDESVHCCVTSPPYWGLRDYGTAKWEGKNTECDHKKESQGKPTWGPGSTESSTLKGKPTNDNHEQEAHYRDTCAKCGARRIDSQLGLEKTPDEYVAKMVEVFREVRRVLRGDGTLWLNLGDGYAGSGKSRGSGGRGSSSSKQTTNVGAYFEPQTELTPVGCKPKDLVGIPWMVAFALRADGWYLRQDIIWAKPNPMPESVTDRCTKAHEYIFLMSKSQRYFYDAAAIAEPLECLPHTLGNIKLDSSRNDHDQMNKIWGANGKRNRRSVWTVSTAPFPGAHFATFPPKLIEPCILAGCPAGGVVLDPFGGSGTVGMVAENNWRNSILIELNPKYVEMAKRRTAQAGLFN